jgi:hypothetical protein
MATRTVAERPQEPILANRLHQIIHRLHLEGGEGELTVHGRENHGR